MQDRNFLAEQLRQQQQRQQPQQRIAPQQLAQGLQQGVEQPQEQASSTGGLISVKELDTRQMLANSLLEQSKDRGAHPLARGIAAFFGGKASQDIGAERTKTERALAEAEAQQRELLRQERLTLSDRQEGRKDEELELKRERLASDAASKKSELTRQTLVDDIAAKERVRKADLDERRLTLSESAASQAISAREQKIEQGKIEEEAALIEADAAAEIGIAQVNELINHPGFGFAVGASSVFPTRPGSDSADFEALFDQIKGEAFLQGFERLKGGGTITEAEGSKALAARTRLSLSQSEGEFKKAANELINIISTGVERQKDKAAKRGISLEVKQQGVSELSDAELERIAGGQ